MRKRLLLLFVVMLLFFAMLGHNVTLILSDKLSEISTVEMSAAVGGVSPNAEGDYMISLKEPDGQLRIPAAIWMWLKSRLYNREQGSHFASPFLR